MLVQSGQIWPTNNSGDIEVLEYINAKKIKVVFLETGNIKWSHRNSIRDGRVRDKIKDKLDMMTKSRDKNYWRNREHKRFIKKEEKFLHENNTNFVEGQIINTQYGKIKIIKDVNSYISSVWFKRTGYVHLFLKSEIAKGLVKDHKWLSLPKGRLKQTYHSKYKQAYSTWTGMMSRCYDISNPSYNTYGGKGVRVCEEWKDFNNYFKWYKSHVREGYHIDKDLKSGYNRKLYSPLTCTVLPQRLNNVLAGEFIDNKKWPVGVNFIRSNNNFSVRARKVNKEGYRERAVLGYFKCPIEAGYCYAKGRSEILRDAAKESYQNGDIDQETYQLFLDIDLTARVDKWVRENPTWDHLKE